MNERLHTELWTSWASLLRSYAAAHGLNSVHQAVVEVSAGEITLRVSDRWLRFTPTEMRRHGEGVAVAFALMEDGSVCIDNGPLEAMDFAGERLAREMIHPG